MNFPTNTTYLEEREKENVMDFAAILTEKEKIPEIDTLDTALATFQSINRQNEKDYDLKYSVKVTDLDKIKEVDIDLEEHNEKERKREEETKGVVVAELYKSNIPSKKVVMETLCDGLINSKQLKGPLHGKNAKELVRKIENEDVYVNILTEDKPKGKLRGKIKKLAFV